MNGRGRAAVLVDLDTTHPAAFVPLLRDLGLVVAAVVDHGDVRPPGYAAEFAREHQIPAVLDDPATTTADVALLMGCDWDRRYALATRLLDAGTAVLLDKPVAGRVGDLRDLAARAAAGQPVGGGSSLRCAPAAVAWRHAGERSGRRVPSSVLVGCAGHPFYYGVHAVALAQALLGEGFTAARALDGSGLRGLLRHSGGAEVLVDVRPPGPEYPYYATVAGDRGVDHVRPDPATLYRPYLAAVLGHLLGDAPAPYSAAGLVEPELMVLALARSVATGNGWVRPGDLPDDFSGWDGAGFTADYRAQGH